MPVTETEQNHRVTQALHRLSEAGACLAEVEAYLLERQRAVAWLATSDEAIRKTYAYCWQRLLEARPDLDPGGSKATVDMVVSYLGLAEQFRDQLEALRETLGMGIGASPAEVLESANHTCQEVLLLQEENQRLTERVKLVELQKNCALTAAEQVIATLRRTHA